MPTYTTNYNIPKPVPGADADTWGAGLNTGMDIIDTQLAGRVTTASLGSKRGDVLDDADFSEPCGGVDG